jgi:hypothetical protein
MSRPSRRLSPLALCRLIKPMFCQEIELRGHIIDSLTLPKVLDESK